MRRFIVYLALVAAVVVLYSVFQLLSYTPSLGAPAQQGNCTTFPETGKTACGKFLQYWQSHGGLAQQGFPISQEMQETSDTDGKVYTMQYFERAVFELHPENQPPNDVLLSLLGASIYQQRYPNGPPNRTPNNDPNNRTFPETGHAVGGVFLNYWNAHGGLAQQGYPISDEFMEVSGLDGKSYRVQYYQRAVFEHHPENAAPYDVLLSQLGTLRYRQKYGDRANPSPIANPTTSPTAPAPLPPTSTYTPIPPAPTDTATPKPTKTQTPVPVPSMCPAFGSLGLSCSDTGNGFVRIAWNVSGGAGQVQGVLTITDSSGGRHTKSVGGRTGQSAYSPCSTQFPPPRIDVSVSLVLHDECGQSVSANCSTGFQLPPCP